MRLAVYLALISSALFGLTSPRISVRLPPAIGTWLLSVGGVLAAAGSTAALALLGFTLAGQSSMLASRGRWSLSTLRQSDPVSTPIAAAALVALALLAVNACGAAIELGVALRSAYRLAADLPARGELAVIQEADLVAFAVPGRPGRIVVSARLLRSLDAGERRAVLAHERAHLGHRHHLHQAAAHLVAAANPLLRRMPAAVALACERWADEDAARLCRRDVVVGALRRTAAVRQPPLPGRLALGAAVLDIASRIRALEMPAPRLVLWRFALPLALLVTTVLAVAYAAHDTERIFELAQYTYRTTGQASQGGSG